MQALQFFKAVTMDEAGLLDDVLRRLDTAGVPHCVFGGQAVNAYVELLVSLDVDIAVAVEALDATRRALSGFRLEDSPDTINLSAPDSDLRLQIQKDARYGEFVSRAERRRVLGMEIPVASLKDVLQGKIWAVEDPGRRPSQRQKDLADIARLLEGYPELAPLVPRSITDRLERA